MALENVLCGGNNRPNPDCEISSTDRHYKSKLKSKLDSLREKTINLVRDTYGDISPVKLYKTNQKWYYRCCTVFPRERESSMPEPEFILALLATEAEALELDD